MSGGRRPEPADRDLPDAGSVVEARPDLGGGAATPSFALPPDASLGLPSAPEPLVIGPRTFAWGRRTYVMGILNVTPDSFSGDGLLTPAAPERRGERVADLVEAAVAQARRMVDDGADILDIGGASSRPGHAPLPLEEEIERVAPVIRAVANALPGTPISVDT
ncbi:MAG TPA: dihydropteroate synthase, partial [Candidatus Limnocylindrales bacterium]